MGEIVGFDLAPFLKLAEIKGFAAALIAELLQAAEDGMLEAVNKIDASSETFS